MNSAARPHQRRNVIAGVVVVGLVVVFTVGRCARVPFGLLHTRTTYRAYFPGQPAVAKGQPVRLGRKKIGSVSRVGAPAPGLQVSVLPARALAAAEVATLLLHDSVKLANTAVLRLEQPGHVVIHWRGGIVEAKRTDPGQWKLVARGAAPALTRNGTLILGGGPGDEEPLNPGDRLGFGADTSAVQVYWGDVDFLTRVDLELEDKSFTVAAEDGGRRPRTGTGVALLTGFGHPVPELELRPSLDPGPPVVVRSDTARELSPVASADPLATLQAVVTYLGSPVALRQPPNNRIERAIANADAVLGHAEVLLRELEDGATGRRKDGVLLRLALSESERRDVDQALASLAGIAGQIDRSGRGDQPGVLGRLALDGEQQRNLSQLLASAGEVNRSVRNVSTITGRLAARDSTLLAHIAGPRADSIVGNVTRLTAELSDPSRSFVRRVGSPDIDSLARKVGTGASSTGAELKKAARTGFFATLALIGVSILHHVVDIVR